MKSNICMGAGLISLDVLIRNGEQTPVSYYVGGTCGNVMMILAHLGWDSYPIARLDETNDAEMILSDMRKHNVHIDFVSTNDGKTPVIVQRNIITKDGTPTHKFESRNNMGRFYLDFKSLTMKQADVVIANIDFVPKIFFFDRVSPAILKLATTFKSKGSVIFFEPSSRGGNINLFNRCVEVSDIIKFSDQRIKECEQFDMYNNKLFIQTQGRKGLRYRFNSEWVRQEPVKNGNVIDTAGAGDWTTATLINELFKDRSIRKIESFVKADIDIALKQAQKNGSQSCSYEGARGMMQ